MQKFLDLPNVKAYLNSVANAASVDVYIRMADETWIKHNSFSGDLKGIVGALMLATDVTAGKFYPEKVAELPSELKKLT